MAGWKKVITSGSAADLLNVTASNLTENDLVIAGAGGALEDSGLTFSGNTFDIGANSIISTGANSVLSGSFSGSFVGDGSGLTGLPDGTTPNSLTDGNGIVNFTFDGSSGASVTVQADGTTLSVGTGGVKVADEGITETQLNTSVAGTGLSGGAGTALSVDYGSTTGTAAQGNTSVTFSGTSNEIELTTNTFTTVGGGGAVQIGLPDDVIIGNDLTVTGDLTVNGTTTTINTSNLLVEDKFILLASGSTAAGDGGIIIDDGANSGKAFFLDGASSGRWGFNDDVSGNDTTATPEAFAAAVVDTTAGQTSTAEYEKNGNIKIENNEIFIWAP